MYKIEVVDTYDRFKRLEPVWNAAVSKSDMDLPFMTFEWFSSWWRIYGRNNQMLVLLVKEDQDIVGIAPFMRSKTVLKGFPVDAISFMDNYHAPRMGLALLKRHSGIVDCIFSFLKNNGYKYDMFMLNSIEKNSATDETVQQVLKTGNIPHIEIPADSSPYIKVEGTWDEYLKSRSKNFRKKMRNISNRFERLGNFEVIKYAGQETEKAMEDVLYISRNSWKYKADMAIASNRDKADFFQSIAETSSLKGWLNVWVLKLGGEPVSYSFNLHYGRKLYSLKIAYHEKYAELSPGKFLDYYVIKDCFENGVSEIDLLGKDDPTKLDWTTFCRGHCKYMIFNATMYGKMLYLLKRKLSRLIGMPYLRQGLVVTGILESFSMTALLSLFL